MRGRHRRRGRAGPVSSATGPAANGPAISAAGCTAVAYRAIRAHQRLTSAARPVPGAHPEPAQRGGRAGHPDGVRDRLQTRAAATGRRGRRLRERPDFGSAADRARRPRQQRTQGARSAGSVRRCRGSVSASRRRRSRRCSPGWQRQAAAAGSSSAGGGRAAGRPPAGHRPTPPRRRPVIRRAWRPRPARACDLGAVHEHRVGGAGLDLGRTARPGRRARHDRPAQRPAEAERRRPSGALSPTRSSRQPAAIIAAHGLFVLATLLLVLLAAIGA